MIDAHAERQKALYQDIWSQDPSYGTAYKDVLDTVAHRIRPHMARVLPEWPVHLFRIVDFGAGDGRFLDQLQSGVGFGVDVYQPVDTRHIWFKQPLWEPLYQTFDYVISTDTLEHLPTDMVPVTLRNIAASAPHGFLRISTKQDIYGTERGLHLHETVQPPEWWLDQLRQAGIQPSSWRIYPGSALEIWF